ncbi:MAG TPA: hypothetical protein VIN03_01715 [Roseateles sp.]
MPKAITTMLEARDSAIYHAAQEVGAITKMLREQADDSDEFSYVLHGSLMRLDVLSLSIILLNGSTNDTEIAEEYELVFGKQLQLEVSHG